MRSETATAPRVLTKVPPWHGWITADTFLLSLASGTFALAALFVLLRPGEMAAIARTAFYAVFPVMLADLVCLVVDLGDPARFHHMLRVFKPSSPMSVGVWTISLFVFIAFLAFAASLLNLPNAVMQSIAIAGFIPALIVAAYKGVLFSTTAQPAWRTMRWLGAAFALSATSMGAAVMLAIGSGAGDVSAARISRFILMWLLVLNALAVRRIMGRVGMAGHLSDLGSHTTLLRVSFHYTVFIVVGLGLPIVLCAFSKGAPTVDAAIVLIVLLGGLVSRHYLVMLPHHATTDSI
jgi:formate-dependent nitrite reductase membrane component NrfD